MENRADWPVHFNTGRKYSAKGQRISACIVEGVAFFRDHDRMIDGKFETSGNRTTLQRDVMQAYDNHRYQMANVPASIRNSHPEV